MMPNDIRDDTRPMSLLSLILSFIALFVVSGLLFVPLETNTRQILIGLDTLICSIFLLQLLIDLIRAADRKHFVKRHWIDFIASVPLVEPLRYARLVQILRVLLELRSSRSLRKQLSRNRRETTVASILLMMVLLITSGSILMVLLEGDVAEANIHNGGDALWWSLVTISTVGYGDFYPVTTAGRILAAGLIISGVGLFGTISGLITSLIVSPSSHSRKDRAMLQQLLTQQQQLLARLDALERQNQPMPKADNPPES
ncbi:potassium channel family protein [Vibrio sp.]|uniref:potassium channel family protein n=1 Tax=Vibrio sp. TaxID=678 RepID=UPI003D146BE4